MKSQSTYLKKSCEYQTILSNKSNLTKITFNSYICKHYLTTFPKVPWLCMYLYIQCTNLKHTCGDKYKSMIGILNNITT